MRVAVFLSTLLILNGFALGLDELIHGALERSPSLESISHRIAANRSKIELSQQFSNPQILYSENTIDDDQAMSQRTFSLKQKLPYFGKRESRKKVALAGEGVIQEELIKAQIALVRSIKEEAYRIWELESLYKITCSYEELTRQNIELFESYTMTSENQHMGIMSAELTLSDLRIRKSRLDAQIDAAYAKLSYLAALRVSELELDLWVGDLPESSELKEELGQNRDIALNEKRVQRQRAEVKKFELENYPDVTLLGGYSQRENFDNYWTFGLGMSLPVYGSEDYKQEEARKLALAAESMKREVSIAVEAQFRSAYARMRSAYETYHILQDEALPKLEHMFELASSSISTGGDLFKYIDVLVQKLKLEQKSIGAVAEYNRAEAKIAALSGELE